MGTVFSGRGIEEADCNPLNMCQKTPYTKKEATTVVNSRGRLLDRCLRIYECLECGAWHVTSQAGFRRKVKVKKEGIMEEREKISDEKLLALARKQINRIGRNEVLKELARRFENTLWIPEDDVNGGFCADDLRRIAEWSHKDGFGELLSFVKSIWAYSDWGWSEKEGVNIIHKPVTEYHISTAGWSSNEEIIGALRRNFVFWGMCFKSHQSGGHYMFHVPIVHQDKNGATV